MRQRLMAIGTFGVALSAFCFACATKVKHLELDPTFSKERITAGPLAILGVVSIATLPDEGDEETFALRMSDVVHQTMRDKRKDVRFVSTGEAAEYLGDDRMSAVMDEFRRDGRFRSSTMDSVAARLGEHALHVLAARITHDEITGEVKEETTTKDGKSTVSGQKYTTKRKMEIAYSIYDLSAGQTVADAVLEGELQRDRTISIAESDGDEGFLDKVGKVVSILDEVFGEEDSKYPDPPTPEALLRETTGRFAKELPGGE